MIVGTLCDVTRKKRIADALMDSESRLATVFSQTMVGILHRDTERNVLMVNDRYLELVGRTAEELVGLPFEEITHPDDREWTAAILREKIKTRESFTVEMRYVRPDGSVIWCEVNVSYVHDPDGTRDSHIIFAHDISDRKAAEAEAKAGAGNAHPRAGRRRGRAPGKSISPTTDCCTCHPMPAGYTACREGHCGALTHEEWAALIDADSLAKMNEEFVAFMASAESHAAEFKIRRADGEERWLRIHGGAVSGQQGRQPLKIVGLIYDDGAQAADEEGGGGGGGGGGGKRGRKGKDRSRRDVALPEPDGSGGARCRRPDSDPQYALAGPLARGSPSGRGGSDRACPVRTQWAVSTRAASRARATAKWVDVVVTPLRDEAGIVTQLLSITRDVTALHAQADRVRWAAEHDTLTGLPNRNYFDGTAGERSRRCASGAANAWAWSRSTSTTSSR